jgi:hypothetical protein
MALAVLFESGWQSMSVSPESMKDNPAKGFLKNIPSAWNDIRFIDGYPGEFAVLARRKGRDWWVVGINAGTAREVTIPLGFLKSGSYKAKLYHDAPAGGTLGFNVPTNEVKNLPPEALQTKIVVSDLVVDPARPLKISMPVNGGFGVKFAESMKEAEPR